MSRFTLTLFPDGRMILSTTANIAPDNAAALVEQWKAWRETPEAVAIITECDVQHATSIEIDLPGDAA